MKYIIMAGGDYKHWEKPRHLTIINGEEIIARTIRLLRENGIEDISISTENPVFEKFNVPILKHKNNYSMRWHDMEGNWYDAFYPTEEPVCYILGDVYFSEEAIKTIIEAKTTDIELFGSMPPFALNYIKNHIEAFALKVVNVKHFKEALKKTKELDEQGKFWKKPIIWELWTVITNAPLQTNKDDFTYNYTKINDYTCDIDWEEDIIKLENATKGGKKMIIVEALEDFSLNDFGKITELKRKCREKEGFIFRGDTFKCDEDLAKYLLGDNKLNRAVVKVIEVIPVEIKEEPKPEIVEEEKPVVKPEIKKSVIKKTIKKKTNKK